MSEDYYARIRFQVPYQRSHVDKVLNAIASAVQDNWRLYRDQWSTPEPEYRVDTEERAELCDPLHLRDAVVEGLSYRRSTAEFGFSFSPLSARVAGLWLLEMDDGCLCVGVSVSRSYLGETRGDRRRDRMEREWDDVRRNRGEAPPREIGPDLDDPEYDEWYKEYYDLEETPNVWPQNKACINHIVRTLQGVLPVAEVSIDPQLQSME